MIPDPGFFFPISDPGVKKHWTQDPEHCLEPPLVRHCIRLCTGHKKEKPPCLGSGSPRRARAHMAADSEMEERLYPPSSATTTRPSASPLSWWVM